nr:hypothetical protein [Blastococcus saxobsidens]
MVALLPGATASAAPSGQPGGTSGVLDSRDLDRLQRRAAEVQEGLRAQQADVVAAREALAAAQSAVEASRHVLADAQGALAVHQREIAGYARAIYRDGGALTPLTILLGGGDPGEVVSAMGFLDAVDAHAAEVIAVAEGHRRAALEERRRAQAALDQARARADEVATRVAELEAAAEAVTAELGQALEVVDGQLESLQREQVAVNERTAVNWRAYVEQLTGAGVAALPAAVLRDPVRTLPDRLVPVAAAGGGAQRGVAQLPGRPSSLLVLPAETLTAVSAAMEALGRPYAPGTAGPDRGTAELWCRRPTSGPAWRSRPARASCSPGWRRSPLRTCSPVTWSSWARRKRGSGTSGWPSTRAPCSPRTPGPVPWWCGRSPGTRCWPSGAHPSACVLRYPCRPRPPARCAPSAAPPSTRRATTAPGPGVAIPTG